MIMVSKFLFPGNLFHFFFQFKINQHAKILIVSGEIFIEGKQDTLKFYDPPLLSTQTHPKGSFAVYPTSTRKKTQLKKKPAEAMPTLYSKKIVVL